MCVFASVRIPGGVAHIEIEVEVNKWHKGSTPVLWERVFTLSTLDWKHPAPLWRTRSSESRCQEQVKLSVMILCGFYSKMDYLYVSQFNEGSQCLTVLQLNIEMCPKGWHSVNSECQTGCGGFLAPVLIYKSVALKQRSYLFNKATQFPCGMPARCRQRFIVSILTGEENKKTPACCSGYCANTRTFPLPVSQTHTPSSVLLIHNWAVTSLCIWHTQFKERPILAAVSPRKGKYFNIFNARGSSGVALQVFQEAADTKGCPDPISRADKKTPKDVCKLFIIYNHDLFQTVVSKIIRLFHFLLVWYNNDTEEVASY